MRTPSRSLGSTVLVVAALTVAVVCWPPGTGAGASSAAGTIPALQYLHVVTPTSGGDLTPYLADGAGRQVLLHGAAAVGMEDVAYPNADGGPGALPRRARRPTTAAVPRRRRCIPQPPLCEVQASRSAFSQSTAPGSGDDFAQMRALGFDVVRLVLNWSQLEPTAGTYSPTYLEPGGPGRRVGAPAGHLRDPRHAPGPVLALHPAGLEGSGPLGLHPVGRLRTAPRRGRCSDDGKPGCAMFGIDELNPAESAVIRQLLAERDRRPAHRARHPGPGLQDHYIGALAALATALPGQPRRPGLRAHERAAARARRARRRPPTATRRAAKTSTPSTRGRSRR